MRPLKQAKHLVMFQLVLAASFVLASNDSIQQALKENQRQFVVTQHHFSAGASWIAYRPLQFTSVQGPVKIKSYVGHSYKFDAGYTFWHNNYFGVYAGVSIGKVCYSLGYTLNRDKYTVPHVEGDFVLRENLRSTFFSFPVYMKFNAPVSKRVSLFCETGVVLTHHFRSFHQWMVLVSDNSFNSEQITYGIFYRNARGNPVYADIPLNVGSLIKLPYGDFVSIKAQLNFTPEDIVTGSVEVYNVGAGNDTRATVKMNTSYFGIEVAYVISGARPWLKKRGYVFAQRQGPHSKR